MNGYPFAGPGGLKTMHTSVVQRTPTAFINHARMRLTVGEQVALWALEERHPPHDVYNTLIAYDNR